MLRGDEAAETIQLYMQYAPEPPFNAGSPETAPPEVVAQVQESTAEIMARREVTARRVAERLGIALPSKA